ncbi:MAG: nuclear transport factor 2 family protein [Gammaproteobacteria bacterium]|nr:nuclear transport factor 2 family protein [Gammaproteobacteria bacterium]MBU1646081.1 nuclear transport factor 2 family protein [Gammaproteobacteria bacterium]MBU1972143.1 nuclear transport factor 2 family protein [Gammaproteobacteria bacterium]
MPDKPIFPTPQDAEAAFYEALERADIEAMMAVWAEDEEIVCIHPGGPRLVGYAAIREAWRRIFDGGARLQVRLSHPTSVQGPLATLNTVIEHIAVRNDESVRAPVVATNVYVRGVLGWRMVLHHASPAPPDSVGNAPHKTLH